LGKFVEEIKAWNYIRKVIGEIGEEYQYNRNKNKGK
jgi:hypothetical protein